MKKGLKDWLPVEEGQEGFAARLRRAGRIGCQVKKGRKDWLPGEEGQEGLAAM